MSRGVHLSRPAAALAWLGPAAVLLAVYWSGLWVWFHADDFSLLWMARLPAHEFWGQLFEPRAQGTYRWISERLFFYSFYQWFGWDSLPYRALVFATQIVNLWLLAALVRRLGGGRWTAAAAAALWAAHHGLAVSMSWTSAYNQVLCSAFLLAALLAFIRFAEKGGLGWYGLQWALFLLGFGALETIAVYPAIAFAYCLLFRRQRWLWTLPMFLGSAAMAWFQLGVAGDRGGAIYEVSLDPLTLLESLRYYLRNAAGGQAPDALGLGLAAVVLALAVFEARRGRWLTLFGWAWFAVTLAPYLPLAGHRVDYYLAIPAAGWAAALAAGAAGLWRRGRAPRLAAAAIVGAHLYGAVPTALQIADDNWVRGMRCRNLITGVAHVRAEFPNETILLTGMESEFFYSSVYHDMFPLAGLYGVYLAPDANSVRQWPGYRPIGRFFLTEEQALLGIERGSLVVYDASGLRLREITRAYREYAPARLE